MSPLGAASRGVHSKFALLVAGAVLTASSHGFVPIAAAQVEEPAYQLHCDDCSGTEYFGELDPDDTSGCQDYQHNLYENWTAEGQPSPDPKFVVASQTDIVEINQASDASFWYYQIVTRAVNWNEVLLKNANIEFAFGDCTDPATRYRLLLSYDLDPTDRGESWADQGNAKIKMYSDSDTGNNRIGDVTNDGPAAPLVANTSDFDSDDNGYNADVAIDSDDAQVRLWISGGNATIEFAISRTAAPLLAIANPFTPCFGRAILSQTSTVPKDSFAINDQRPTPDFSSTSWAVDSCNGANVADPCDPAPDCTSSDTACGIASCDPAGSAGNCDTLTPRTIGTVCRADAGECDVAETCDGVNTGDCPANAFEPGGTACGSSSDTICDNADTCDGAGNCDDNNEPGSTPCRADAGECDVAESCDGSGSCPSDSLEPNGTACGSSSDTICTDPDTCDDGTCEPNDASGATLCRAATGECDIAENCDGAGSCPGDSVDPGGTPCGSSSDTICDNADTCDGDGNCDDNNEPGSTLCRADAGDCDVAENCDGAGSCPGDAFEPEGGACGNPADTICDDPDTCDGDGSCEPNNASGATLCRADAGECDVAENCDGAGSCPADGFEPLGEPCGSSSDTICDNADTCDGAGNCDDNNEPGSTPCRADAGDCDVPENCDGSGSCPANGLEPEGTACGSGTDTPCDNPDTCSAGGTCLPNLEPNTTVCRADAGECDVAETCDGSGNCPANVASPGGTPCGSSSDTICDNADTCDGLGNCDDNNEPGSTPCRADAGECDVAESCDGSGSCPADADAPDGTPCGSSTDTICNNPDTCDDGVCEPNNEPGSTLCRADAGACDVAETCDGSGNCPANALEPNGTACGSSSDTICTNPDTCDDGVCEPNHESSSTLCRADAGACDVAELCDGSGSCPANAFEPDGTSCGSSTDTVCNNPDTCDDGVCEPNNEPGSTVCRVGASICDASESCDGSGNCPADAFAPDSTPCRASAGVCDEVENCTGSTGSCPANDFDDAGTPCRPSAGICDEPETCDGSTAACPGNDFVAGGTTCRPTAGECDEAEECTGSTASCPVNEFDDEGTPCTTDGNVCTDDECNGSGVCDHVDNEASCDDAAFCTVNDVCDNGTCSGTPRNCNDGVECTDDSCSEGLDACVNQPDDDFCDDDDTCTEDVCTPSGCTNEPTCGVDICRTAGYWSTHGGYGKPTSYNVVQAVLDAVGGIDVCGQHIDETSNEHPPWVAGLELDSALEGLCVSVEGISERQLYRQLIAAALNCAMSGGDCDDKLEGYVEVTFSECSDLCETGDEQPGGPSVQECIEKIDCFNNGGQIVNGQCVLNLPGNCHDQLLCNEGLGVCPKKAPASSVKACRQAKDNSCTIDSCN